MILACRARTARFVRGTFGWAVVVVVAGCAAEESAEPVGIDVILSFCAKMSERLRKCDPSAAPDLSQCQDDVSCSLGLMRPEVGKPLLECLSSRACGISDDACSMKIAQETPESGTRQSYAQRCVTAHSTCSLEGKRFSDDWCSDGDIPWKLYHDDLLQGLSLCFDKSCPQITECLAATITEAARDNPACEL